ncbi:signal peptidase II [bacterium]|nr:signal peptidase II [bacterium]
MSKTKLFLFAFIIIVSDIFTKYLVTAKMSLGQIIELPVGFVQLHYIRNYGAAFGIMQNQHWFFVTAAITAIALILYFFETIKEHGGMAFAAACLVLGGAIGNLLDRLRFGYVVDFIDLKVWPIFNVADIALTVGMGLLFLMMLGVGVKYDEADSEADVGKNAEGSPDGETGGGLGTADNAGAPAPSGAVSENEGGSSGFEEKASSAESDAVRARPTDAASETELNS